MDIAIKVTGLTTLFEQLRSFGDEVGAKILRTAARKAFQPVYAAAHRYALPSMDTGALLDAIKLQVAKPKEGDTIVAVGIRISGKMPRSFKRARGLDHRNPARRWHFVEFGTVNMPAAPFLRPAMEQNQDVVIAILKRELAAGIKRMERKNRRNKP
jgi:HK97 gp10 family phage protein